jgi:anti-anti-sigma regulatory factor
MDRAMKTHHASRVSIDLEQVEYISSGILGWLAALSKRLHDQSPAGRLHLYRVRPLIDQLCRQVCLDRTIEIHPPDEAPPMLA